jgi:hypothetical protein
MTTNSCPVQPKLTITEKLDNAGWSRLVAAVSCKAAQGRSRESGPSRLRGPRVKIGKNRVEANFRWAFWNVQGNLNRPLASVHDSSSAKPGLPRAHPPPPLALQPHLLMNDFLKHDGSMDRCRPHLSMPWAFSPVWKLWFMYCSCDSFCSCNPLWKNQEHSVAHGWLWLIARHWESRVATLHGLKWPLKSVQMEAILKGLP